MRHHFLDENAGTTHPTERPGNKHLTQSLHDKGKNTVQTNNSTQLSIFVPSVLCVGALGAGSMWSMTKAVWKMSRVSCRRSLEVPWGPPLLVLRIFGVKL